MSLSNYFVYPRSKALPWNAMQTAALPPRRGRAAETLRHEAEPGYRPMNGTYFRFQTRAQAAFRSGRGNESLRCAGLVTSSTTGYLEK